MKCINTFFNQAILTQSICFVVLFFTISLGVFAQYDDTHLEPVEKGINENSKLYRNFTDKPEARLTVYPAFRNKYALSIEQKSREHYLLSNTLSEDQWEVVRSQWRKVDTVTSKQYKIDRSFYENIRQLFEIVTSQIRIRKVEKQIIIIDGEEFEKIPTMKLDGVVYYLSTTNSNGELLTGKTHSPRKNTLMGRLADICDDLYSLSQGEEISKDGIETKMKSLIANMQNENFSRTFDDTISEYPFTSVSSVFHPNQKSMSNGEVRDHFVILQDIIIEQ